MNTVYSQIPSLLPLFPIGRCRMTVFDFINQVDRVYRGLGIPTLYGVLSVLANKSVFFIGERGTGKTRTIKLIPQIDGTYVSKWDTFTYQELSTYCKKLVNFSKVVENKHMVFKIEEFATFSDYHREKFLTVGSRIISDGSYTHVTTHSPFLNIQNCKLTMLVAIQPLLYNRLCNNYTEWEALSYDRFTKFIVLNPLRQKTLDVDLVPTLPRKINHQATLHENEVNLDALITLFKGHVSGGRATLYARDYAIAMAGFLGAETVQQKHVDLFHQLFHPYLDSFAVLQIAEDLDSPVKVTTGSMKLLGEIGKYNDYVEKKKLATDLHVSERSIERGAKSLLEAELVEKPSSHAGRYRLSENLRNFFNWYRGLLS